MRRTRELSEDGKAKCTLRKSPASLPIGDDNQQKPPCFQAFSVILGDQERAWGSERNQWLSQQEDHGAGWRGWWIRATEEKEVDVCRDPGMGQAGPSSQLILRGLGKFWEAQEVM